MPANIKPEHIVLFAACSSFIIFHDAPQIFHRCRWKMNGTGGGIRPSWWRQWHYSNHRTTCSRQPASTLISATSYMPDDSMTSFHSYVCYRNEWLRLFFTFKIHNSYSKRSVHSTTPAINNDIRGGPISLGSSGSSRMTRVNHSVEMGRCSGCLFL